MPKIRGVKPEFWTDEDIVELSIPARLLFIGTWNFACDNGHLDDKPKQLKMKIFPADELDVEPLLEELVRCGRITRTDGVITIHRFADHQKPHKRWWQTCDQPWCNVPEGASDKPSNRGKGPSQGADNGGATVGQPLSNGGATADGDGDCEGDGDSRARKRASRLPPGWRPSPQVWDQMRDKRPDIDHEKTLEAFTDYWTAKSGSNATKLDWDATWRNWVRNQKPDRHLTPVREEFDWQNQGWGR